MQLTILPLFPYNSSPIASCDSLSAHMLLKMEKGGMKQNLMILEFNEALTEHTIDVVSVEELKS